MDVSLRPAVPEDLAKIHGIESVVQKSPWKEQDFENELKKEHSRTLVLTDDETDELIFGYIVFWSLAQEGEILNLAVALDHRGLGFGLSMIRKALGLLQNEGVELVRLNVRKSNDPALQIYHKVGFDITQVRRRFYSDGEDAYEMQLSLGDELNSEE